MKKTHAGGLIIGPHSNVLVVHQSVKSWSFPKGHIEGEENSLETARREVGEESGISELEYIKSLGVYQRYNLAGTESKTIEMFLFRTKQTELLPVDPGILEARWVSPDEVVEMLSHEKDREFFLGVKDLI